VEYFDAEDRRRREKAGTWSSARDLYTKRKNEARKGVKLPDNLRKRSTKFSEIAAAALAYSKTHKRSYYDDTLRMEKMLGWFRDARADSITAEEIERHLEQGIKDNGWKASTVNHYRALLSLTFRLAILNADKTGVRKNPIHGTTHRKLNNERVRCLTDEEEAALRKVIDSKYPEHRAELDIALHTGMRQKSEQYALRWEHVNLKARRISVKGVENDRGIPGKTGKGRNIPLNRTALAALEELRMRGNEVGPVFRDLAGKPLSGPRVWFDKAIKEAKVEDFHWHDLRHTFASRLVMSAIPLKSVMELMGHKNISMTARYAHMAPGFQLDAVSALDDYALNGSGTPLTRLMRNSVEKSADLQGGQTATTAATSASGRTRDEFVNVA
jgi:integrase